MSSLDLSKRAVKCAQRQMSIFSSEFQEQAVRKTKCGARAEKTKRRLDHAVTQTRSALYLMRVRFCELYACGKSWAWWLLDVSTKYRYRWVAEEQVPEQAIGLLSALALGSVSCTRDASYLFSCVGLRNRIL